jgi:hypothetical protein
MFSLANLKNISFTPDRVVDNIFFFFFFQKKLALARNRLEESNPPINTCIENLVE